VAFSLIHNYSLQRNHLSHSTVHYTRTESPLPDAPHQSSGTGFQRRPFPFLGSRTISVPQPQQHLTYIALTSPIFFRLLLSLGTSQQLLLLELCPVTNFMELKSITTNGQSASLSWFQVPIWDPRPIFLHLSLITFIQFRACWCGAPTLTRSRVCSFQILLGISSADFLRSGSNGTHERILLSLLFKLPQPEGQVPVFISLRNKVAQLYPRGIGFTGARSRSHITTDSRSASVRSLIRDPRPATNFFFLLDIFFRHLLVCYFVAPSLTRGRVCNLQLLLVLASVVAVNLRPTGSQPVCLGVRRPSGTCDQFCLLRLPWKRVYGTDELCSRRIEFA
jgi:hypothetical protein